MKALDLYLSPIIEYESYVPSFSKMIGKTFNSIKREFDVKIDHYHPNPDISRRNRKKPLPNITIKSGMVLKILGLPKNINKLCEAYNLP